jgi:hypothetical protein
MKDDEKTKIEVGPQLGAVLEERAIGVEDVRSVIAYAEETKNAFVNNTTGHSLAYHRPSKVTYWVEFGLEGDSYRIYRAYSHRMKILEGFNMPARLKEANPEWMCAKCGVSLELATVKLIYLEETFGVDFPACPSCQRVLISEEKVVEKIALAEKMLEDK